MHTARSMHTFDVALPHGITLACRANFAWDGTAQAASTKGKPRVLLLHGFPEAAFVWDEVIALLSDGVQCLAPNLRGFAGSSAPTDVSAYRAKHLVQDIDALVRAWGGAADANATVPPVDVLVAHDWGGAVAWNVAVQKPQLLKHLCMLNSPHPATFLRELRHNPAQQKASAYMHFLCRPDAAALLAANDYERLWAFFTNMGGNTWLDERTRAQYREVWQQGLEGALNYYRATPLKPALDAASPLHTMAFADADVTVHHPTTVLWGDADVALPPALLDGLKAYVPRMTLTRVPDATHWIVHEQPALVAKHIALGVRP
jgi:epoxide hydrolase 4